MTEPATTIPNNPFHRIAVLAAGGVLLGAFLVGHTTLILRTRDLEPNLATVVANFLHGFVWIFLAPLASRLARRYPVVGPHWGRHLALHALFALVADALMDAAILLVTIPIDEAERPISFLLINNFLAALPLYLLLWLTVVALTHAYDYARQSYERNRRAAELEAQLAQARLGALRAQLKPHFLFNTLNAASTLMARDVQAARGVLGDLSALLRLSLDRFDAPEVQLDDELDFLGHYLDIEQTRFNDRLQVDFDIDPSTRDALVPPLILQPLAENAVKHAVAPSPGGGAITIHAERREDVLRLAVADHGPGLAADDPEPGTRAGGIGLRNTRSRLANLYGDAGRLDLQPTPGGGLTAVVELPFHTEPLPPTSRLR